MMDDEHIIIVILKWSVYVFALLSVAYAMLKFWALEEGNTMDEETSEKLGRLLGRDSNRAERALNRMLDREEVVQE